MNERVYNCFQWREIVHSNHAARRCLINYAIGPSTLKLCLQYLDKITTTLVSCKSMQPCIGSITCSTNYKYCIHCFLLFLAGGGVFSLSTIDLSTLDSLILFIHQLLIASHKQFKGGSECVDELQVIVFVFVIKIESRSTHLAMWVRIRIGIQIRIRITTVYTTYQSGFNPDRCVV